MEIKFRAKNCYGEIFYGYYAEIDNCGYLIQSNGDKDVVDQTTLSQFIGYDEDGNEIYEGDMLQDRNGYIWIANTKNYGMHSTGNTIALFRGSKTFGLKVIR